MIARTGVLLAFTAGAWMAGGAIAWAGRWHPFDDSRPDAGVSFHALLPGHEVHHARIVRVPRAESVSVVVRREMVAIHDDVLDAGVARELSERAAPHAIHDPSSRAVLLSSGVLSGRPRAYPDADMMLLWPAVAARLEAAGALPPHVHSSGVAPIRARPARRGVR